jgi:hypothetical protein
MTGQSQKIALVMGGIRSDGIDRKAPPPQSTDEKQRDKQKQDKMFCANRKKKTTRSFGAEGFFCRRRKEDYSWVSI